MFEPLWTDIAAYLAACPAFGVAPFDMFQTVDLFEGKGMRAVLSNLLALGNGFFFELPPLFDFCWIAGLPVLHIQYLRVFRILSSGQSEIVPPI